MIQSFILIFAFLTNNYRTSNLKRSNFHENKIQSQYNNFRNLLENDTVSDIVYSHSNDENKGMSNHQKHIKIIIILVIVVASLTVIVSSIFLIMCLKKKCKKKKEEQEISKNDNSNVKNKKLVEMSNVFSSHYFRRTFPIKRFKTFSCKNFSVSKNLGINPIQDIMEIQHHEQDDEECPKKNNEYSDITFLSDKDIKDNDL